MREWLKEMDQIDRECVQRYEYLLGRKLQDREEYREIDAQVDEMILEWDSRIEFFNAYPDLQTYRAASQKQSISPLQDRIDSAKARSSLAHVTIGSKNPLPEHLL